MAGYSSSDNDFLGPFIECLLFGYYTVRRPVIGMISRIGPAVIGIINEYRLQQGYTMFCATAEMYCCHPFAYLSGICNVDVMDPLPFWVYFQDPSPETSKISYGTSQKEN